MKHLEGKTIWLIPYGNCVARGKKLRDQITSVTLVKVARVKAVIKEGERIEREVRMKSHNRLEIQNYNGGYAYFESKEDVLKHLDEMDLRQDITRHFRGFNPLEDVELTKLIKIAQLLGIETEGNNHG